MIQILSHTRQRSVGPLEAFAYVSFRFEFGDCRSAQVGQTGNLLTVSSGRAVEGLGCRANSHQNRGHEDK